MLCDLEKLSHEKILHSKRVLWNMPDTYLFGGFRIGAGCRAGPKIRSKNWPDVWTPFSEEQGEDSLGKFSEERGEDSPGKFSEERGEVSLPREVLRGEVSLSEEGPSRRTSQGRPPWRNSLGINLFRRTSRDLRFPWLSQQPKFGNHRLAIIQFSFHSVG